MTTDPTVLRNQLALGLGEAVVEEVSENTLRVLVPSTRHRHDMLSVLVRLDEMGAVVTDTGELSGLAGDDLDGMIDLLNCAGAEFEVIEGLVSAIVDDPEDIASTILSVAHYLSAAPVVWHARQCIEAALNAESEEAGTTAPARTPSTHLMARNAKDQLIRRYGNPAKHFVRLNTQMKARGETARPPVSLRTQPTSTPRLLASFVDATASARAATWAKRESEWVFTVARDLTVPKYLVVRGDAHEVEHLGQFYDHQGVTVLSDDELSPLEEDVGNIFPELQLT